MKENILDLPLPSNPKSKTKKKIGKDKIKIQQTYFWDWYLKCFAIH
jgi:hypothetical protein